MTLQTEEIKCGSSEVGKSIVTNLDGEKEWEEVQTLTGSRLFHLDRRQSGFSVFLLCGDDGILA